MYNEKLKISTRRFTSKLSANIPRISAQVHPHAHVVAHYCTSSSMLNLYDKKDHVGAVTENLLSCFRVLK